MLSSEIDLKMQSLSAPARKVWRRAPGEVRPMIETDPRLLQGTRFTASSQIAVSVAGTQTECSPSQGPANRKADLARLQSSVAELLCTINMRRRGNRTLSEERIW